MINFDKKATDLINAYPYDERARLRDGITQALREAYEAGRKAGRYEESAEAQCDLNRRVEAIMQNMPNAPVIPKEKNDA